MGSINWTNQAVNDLKNIFEFIALDSKYYAKREISKIKLRVENLKIFPLIGRHVPELQIENVREIIQGRYRIVYKIVSKNHIDILTIHHSSKANLEIPIQ